MRLAYNANNIKQRYLDIVNILWTLLADRVDIGKKRALQIAAAFGVHPATIMFPEYEAVETKLVA
jgi:hypothetical protein